MEAVPVLDRIGVAPVTRSVRPIPTRLPLGEAEGPPVDRAASVDDLEPIRRAFPGDRAGALGPTRRGDLCRAVRALADR